MSRLIDLTGKQFGEWTVLRIGQRDSRGRYKWLCRCSCGREIEVAGNSLRNGYSKGCRRCAVPHNRTKYTGDPVQVILAGMRQRCYYPKCRSYKNYGGRGIAICQEWLDDPVTFYDWAYANGYRKGLSIERLDNDKGYSPDNCTFIRIEDQSKNRRHNHWVTINGITKNLTEWCNYYKINRDAVRSRLKRGWSYEDALTKPIKGR